jgi:hypothetical protein
MSFGFLGAECLTAGSSEPGQDFLSLVNTPVGQAVRQAVKSRFVFNAPQAAASSDDLILSEYLRARPTGVMATWLAQGKISRAQAMSLSDFRNYAAARRSTPTYLSQEEALLDRIVAVYLQWTWVPKWNSRQTIRPEEIIQDPCLGMAVQTVAPMTTDKGPQSPVSTDWLKWALIGGAVLVGGFLVYKLAKKRRGSKTPALLAGPSVPLALPAPTVKGI